MLVQQGMDSGATLIRSSSWKQVNLPPKGSCFPRRRRCPEVIKIHLLNKILWSSWTTVNKPPPKLIPPWGRLRFHGLFHWPWKLPTAVTTGIMEVRLGRCFHVGRSEYRQHHARQEQIDMLKEGMSASWQLTLPKHTSLVVRSLEWKPLLVHRPFQEERSVQGYSAL